MSAPIKSCDRQLHILAVTNADEEVSSLQEVMRVCDDQTVMLTHSRSLPEALAKLSSSRFDVILCDYNPGDGLALRLVREIRQQKHNMPIVFLSDHMTDASVQTVIQAEPGPASSQIKVLPQLIRSAVQHYATDRQHRKAEQMLKKLFRAVEQSQDIIMIADETGVIEYVNPACEALTGYGRAETAGKNMLMFCNESGANACRDIWSTVYSGQRYRGVMENRRKTGQVFLCEKTITPLRDSEGRITNLISTDRDVTERHRLEAQLRQAQKMDAIGRLAGGVAHDFNNLLMVISSYAELMLDALAAEHPLRRNVLEILTASRRASDLTRQLLAFGRQQVQRLQLLDLNHIIREISKMLPRLIGEDIEIVSTAGKDLGKVKADPVQIEQILMNLAANARDAMPGGGKLTIETASVRLDDTYVQRHTMVPAGDYVLLAVTDSGCGIDPEDMPHIFEPFYTTKEEGKGTGLGLATVYGIVKQSGGFVWVYSEPRLGTTFKVYLPRVEQGVAEPAQQQKAESSFAGSETLLLVEDETAVRHSAREFLVLAGYTVLEAVDGEDAIRIAGSYHGPIHLMVSDVIMPKMGGAHLAAQLAITRPEMKVLFVSGYAERTVLRHGAIDVTTRFLQKPFSLKMLARKIREVLAAEQESAIAASTK